MASGEGAGLPKSRLVWFVVFLLVQMLVVGVLVPSDFLVRQVQLEREQTAQWFGETMAEELVEATNDRFNRWFVETGIVEAVRHHLVPTQEERAAEPEMDGIAETVFPFVETRLEVFWTVLYQSLQRAQLIAIWAPYMLPIWLPALWHGFAVRRVKQLSYGYAAPNRFHAAALVLAFLLTLVPAYLMAPLAIPPSVVPLWGFAVAWAGVVIVANLQKQL